MNASHDHDQVERDAKDRAVVVIDGDSPPAPDSARLFVEHVNRDLEQFAALASTHGTHSQRETPLDVMVGVDPAFAGRVQTSIDAGGIWWLGSERVGEPLGWSMLRRARRGRIRKHIRRAARAHKARRGWR